ncbi:hypothetical protein [Massilia cavernae]|nr:hypothetical protein [Massilia cavernae]
MKWILTFIGGTLLGAIAAFISLNRVGSDTPPVPPVAVTAPAPAAAPAGQLEAALPGAPDMPPDLTEADLPIRPASRAVPSITQLGGAGGSAAPLQLMVPVEGTVWA